MKINKIGFEFEVLVRQTEFLTIWNALYGISKAVRLGGDGTVQGGFGWRDLEIKTEPLSEERATDLFNKILAMLVSFNMAGVLKTNDTCGLHINVSTDSMSTSYFNVIQKYNDGKYLDLWNRRFNPTCEPLSYRGNESDYYNDPCEYMTQHRGKKHVAVALRNSDDLNGIRLENRIIGGKDYILRDNDLETTIRDFLNIVTQ